MNENQVNHFSSSGSTILKFSNFAMIKPSESQGAREYMIRTAIKMGKFVMKNSMFVGDTSGIIKIDRT